MAGQLQPQHGRKRKYRSWLRNPDPVPPRTTADRIRARQQLAGENDGDGRNENRFGHHAEPQGPAEEIVGDDDNLDIGEAPPAEEPNNISGDSSNHETSSESSSGSSFSEHREEATSQSDESSSEDEISDDESYSPTKQQDLEEDLYPGLNCTKFESLLMILNFSFRHGLTQTATEDLCKMFNNILGGNYIPFSKYMFRKIFGNSPYQFHFYCRQCESYLGFKLNLENRNGRMVCHLCQQVCDVRTMNNGHFFITFPLKQQLKFLLENTADIMNLLQYRFNRNVDADLICDVFDGKVYSNLCEAGKFLSEPFNFSLTFSTDGAQVYDSSHNSLWPVTFRLNELPPGVRFDFTNIMVSGIWFGKSEPSMSLFLKTFVNEVNGMFENGFTWRSPANGIIKSKCILLNCVADSKAKPLVQAVKMHNGYWGCGYCNHPGLMYDGSKQAKYPVNNDLVMMDDLSFNYTVDAMDPEHRQIHRRFNIKDRTNEIIRQDMEIAEERRNARGEGDVRGVRGKSVLTPLLSFDLVFGFVVDYMHAVLLGVARHVTDLWLNSTNHNEFYYIGRRMGDIDEKLLHIKPPVCISRRPRSLNDRVHWKANEWRSWLLYYSLPCLKGILPTRYLQHHCLLVSAVHLLLQDSISKRDLADATYYLGSYCVKFGILYAEHLVRFNVHLLMHLGKCVSLWGPLFCYSAFSFESATGRLVQLVKGSRGVLSQIANKYTKCKMIPKLLKMYHVGESTHSFCEDLMCYRSSQTAKTFDNVTVFGSLRIVLSVAKIMNPP